MNTLLLKDVVMYADVMLRSGRTGSCFRTSSCAIGAENSLLTGCAMLCMPFDGLAEDPRPLNGPSALCPLGNWCVLQSAHQFCNGLFRSLLDSLGLSLGLRQLVARQIAWCWMGIERVLRFLWHVGSTVTGLVLRLYKKRLVIFDCAAL